MRSLSTKVLNFGLGEAVTRFVNLMIIVFVARHVGVEALGTYSYGQTIAQNTITISDLGFKPIGARLVAIYPFNIPFVISKIQMKRLILSLIAVTGGIFYTLLGPVKDDAKIVIIIFVLSALPNSFNLEWVLWGEGKFTDLALWKTSVSLLFLIFSILGILFFTDSLLGIAIANHISLIFGAIILITLLAKRGQAIKNNFTGAEVDEIDHQASWSNSLWLGLATIFNQIFHSGDVLFLGALTSSIEVGNYSAAYKIMFFLFGFFYLINNAIYPIIAKKGSISLKRRSLLLFILIVFFIGALISLAGTWMSNTLLFFIYGREFTVATELLKILMITLPFEFIVTLLGSILVAWGLNKTVMCTTGIAAVFNTALNLYYIPIYGSKGSAWITVMSYILLFLLLLIVFFMPNFNYLFRPTIKK